MKYRPDIDGLRAIAIILVLIYHGGFSCFPSGFVGVDVFFVISGFLITHIIHESLTREQFSFVDFYNRRLWRLQPVLLCFILVTTVLTLLFFLPDDLLQYTKSARKTSLFISNVFFSKTTTSYFAPNTLQLPLLHTWSLSIEWQCYFILPLAIYGLYRLVGRNSIRPVLYLLTILCFAWSLYDSQRVPAQTYYQFSSRIFEFLIGSCIALMPPPRIVINQYIIGLVGGMALILIFYIASLDHILLGYPNWYACLVCFATGLLIALGRFYPAHYVGRILSFKYLVFIGLISYSLYVWHWAIFAFLRYQNIQESPLVLLAMYGLIFFISYLSWNYIEKPARRYNTIKFRYTFASLVLLPILAVHVSAYFIKVYDGLPRRFNQELVNVYHQLDQYASAQRPQCISNDTIDAASECLIGSKKVNAKTGLMIGDSFSNHYWGFMDTLGQDANVSILAQGISSCITLPEIYLYDWWHFKNQVYQECFDHTAKYYQMIADTHYDYVIIGQIWSNYLGDNIIHTLGDERSLALSKKRLEQALDKALAMITASGAKPVLIKTSALMQENFHDCFFKHIKLRKAYDPKECSFAFTLSPAEQWFGQLFAKMKIKYPQLIVIDPKKVQCQDGRCSADIHGIPVYRDVGHITDYASYQFAELYLREFSNPLKVKRHFSDK